MRAADFLARTFRDLHWIGLTPDQVIAHVRKRLLVRPYEFVPKGRILGAPIELYRERGETVTRLELLGVEMHCDNITAALKKLNEDFRDSKDEWEGFEEK